MSAARSSLCSRASLQPHVRPHLHQPRRGSLLAIPLTLLVVALVPQRAAGQLPSAPVAVSPGSLVTSEPLGGACVTFSWSGVDGAIGYELVLFEAEESSELETVFQTRVPGDARAWSPPATLCPGTGSRFAWAVRAVGDEGAGAWSEPLLFETGGEPSEHEVRAAVSTLQRYLHLASRDRGETGVTQDGAPAGTAGEPDPDRVQASDRRRPHDGESSQNRQRLSRPSIESPSKAPDRRRTSSGGAALSGGGVRASTFTSNLALPGSGPYCVVESAFANVWRLNTFSCTAEGTECTVQMSRPEVPSLPLPSAGGLSVGSTEAHWTWNASFAGVNQGAVAFACVFSVTPSLPWTGDGMALRHSSFGGANEIFTGTCTLDTCSQLLSSASSASSGDAPLDP